MHLDPLSTPPSAIDSLDDVQRAFRVRVPDDMLRGLINTRVFLRTGINLKAASPEQSARTDAVKKVLRALDELGYTLDGS